MLLQALLVLDIAAALLFIALCILLAIRTRAIIAVPIALGAFAFLLQWLFTAAAFPWWTEDLRSLWGRGFYILFTLSTCVLLYLLLRRR